MENYDYQASLFDAPDLWKISSLSHDPASDAPTLFINEGLDSQTILNNKSDIFGAITTQSLRLPDLVEDFVFESIDVTEPALSPDFSSSSLSAHNVGPLRESVDEDVWDLILDDIDTAPWPKVDLSWEAFYGKRDTYEAPKWLSEAGPRAFDAALARGAANKQETGDTGAQKTGQPVKSDALLQSLFALGSGHSSALFTYSQIKPGFKVEVERLRASGCSLQVSEEVIHDIGDCGEGLRSLKVFVDASYHTDKGFPGRVALATAITSITDAVELFLDEHKATVKSILQLQAVFSRPTTIVGTLLSLLDVLRSAKHTESLCSLLFHQLQQAEHESDWLRDLLLELLIKASQPWLELADEWLGLRPDLAYTFGRQAQVESFVEWQDAGVDGGTAYLLRRDRTPAFVLDEDAETLFETGVALRLLMRHQPSHPLLAHHNTERVHLRWRVDLDETTQSVHIRMRQEADVHNVVEPASLNGDKPTAIDDLDLPEQRPIPNSIDNPWQMTDNLMMPIETRSETSSRLATIIGDYLNGRQDLSATETADRHPLNPAHICRASFSPLIYAQSRLINSAVLRMLFSPQHDLRLHLSAQRQFHLFGNGIYLQRLTTALFDPNTAATERQLGSMRGSSGTMGLRLGDRESWPPASSELRLALMGILVDCFNAGLARAASQRSVDTTSLPGNISFSIRQLDESQIHRIIDPTSLYAIDFLRLQYHATSPLDAILTPKLMDRYDDIFRFLLRIVRVQFVLSRLPRIGGRDVVARDLKASLRGETQVLVQRYAQQSLHFVQSCLAYFMDDVIMESWTGFEGYLDGVEKALSTESETGSPSHSVESIRRRHEMTLDRMTAGLLLRSRQSKALAALDDVLSQILIFASAMSQLVHAVARPTAGTPSEVDRLTAAIEKSHAEFLGQVRIFLTVCQAFVEKTNGPGVSSRGGGAGDEAFDRGGEVLDRLLLRIDMNGYYGAM